MIVPPPAAPTTYQSTRGRPIPSWYAAKVGPLLALGLTTRQVAARLGISQPSVVRIGQDIRGAEIKIPRSRKCGPRLAPPTTA